jgi:hypothetical protein
MAQLNPTCQRVFEDHIRNSLGGVILHTKRIIDSVQKIEYFLKRMTTAYEVLEGEIECGNFQRDQPKDS